MTSDVHEMRSGMFDGDPRAEEYDYVDEFDDDDQPEDYRTVAGTAVAALIAGIASPAALLSPVLLLIPILGVLLGVLAIRRVRRESEFYTGFGLALFGLLMSVLMVTSAGAMHSVIRYVEVPERYRDKVIKFRDLQPDPKHPELPISPLALEKDGQEVFVKGYIYPGMRRRGLTKFILVPDMKTCCFGGQPKLTDMIEVRLRDPLTADFARKRRGVGGVLRVHRELKPNPELTGVFYELEADYIK